MSLRDRLTRLERQGPPVGEHQRVLDIVERETATEQTYRCTCGEALCAVHPSLTLILMRDTDGPPRSHS